MSLTSRISRWCVPGDTICGRSTKCAWWEAQSEAIHYYGRPCGACAWTKYTETKFASYGTQQSFPADFPLLVSQNCHWAAVMKNVRQVGTKETDDRTQSKAHGFSIDISSAVPWWRRRVSRPDRYKGCTHYPRIQAAINALASQWISLQDKIQI